MRLFEAILDANHRAIAGDTKAGVHIADFESELPVVALTCVDPRLNALFPNVLGVPGDQFIWLRNAGNTITSSMSSTVRSLSLACAVKGGKEIAIIGHTDCQVVKSTAAQLIDKFKALGIERQRLPENLTDFFGLSGSERQSILKACEFVRQSPLISPTVPVHGLLVDIDTGKLELLVNGYQNWETMRKWNDVVTSGGQTVDALKALTDFQIGEMKFPDTKIGETVTKAEDWLSKKLEQLEMAPSDAAKIPVVPESAVDLARRLAEAAQKHWPGQGAPPKITTAPPMRPRPQIRKPK